MISTTIWTTTLMINKKNSFSVVITAAGKSSRMQGEKKEYLHLHDSEKNISVLSECMYKFLNTGLFNSMIVTIPKDDIDKIHDIVFKDKRIPEYLNKNETKIIFTEGGETRQKSVFNALRTLEQYNEKKEIITDYVLIHDGARPFVGTQLIESVCKMTPEKGSVIPAIPAVDTQKTVGKDGKITEHLHRSSIFAVQTPQGFDFQKLLKAHKLASNSDNEFTDDSEIYSLLRESVFICDGEITNKKITYKEDLKK